MHVANASYNYGFLTVIDVPELGLCGGLLLLTEIGRPIEFHCTTPVQANRAQEILYGRTYNEFLYCDQIGASLIAKAKASMHIVITDCGEMLALASKQKMPFALLQSCVAGPRAESRCDSPMKWSDTIAVSDWQLSFSAANSIGINWAAGVCQQFADTLPLDEPFERIRQAIEEAQAVAARS
jgi:hypothetical protein